MHLGEHGHRIRRSDAPHAIEIGAQRDRQLTTETGQARIRHGGGERDDRYAGRGGLDRPARQGSAHAQDDHDRQDHDRHALSNAGPVAWRPVVARGEGRSKIGGGGEALPRALGERSLDRSLHPGRNLRANGRHPRRLGDEMLMHDSLEAEAGEWRLPNQHLVKHAPQAVHVGPAVEFRLTGCLLGAHVLRCADGDPRFRQALPAGRGDRPGDAEIRHHRVPRPEQDVLGLHVPMDHMTAVRVAQRIGHLARDVAGVVRGELSLAPEPVSKRFALDVGHHVVQEPGGFAGIVQRQNVGMRESRGDLDLLEESLRAERTRNLGL